MLYPLFMQPLMAFIRSGRYEFDNSQQYLSTTWGFYWRATVYQAVSRARDFRFRSSNLEVNDQYNMAYGFSVRANRHAIMLAPGIHADEPSAKQIIPRVRCRRIRGSPKVAAILNDDATNSSIIKSASYEAYGSCKQKSFYKLLFAAEQRNPDRQGLLCYSG